MNDLLPGYFGSLVTLAACVGVLATGCGVFGYLYRRTGDKSHLGALLIGVCAIGFMCGELSVIAAAMKGDAVLGRQLHRIQALCSASFIPCAMYFIAHYLDLTPRWRYLNRLFAWVALLFLIAVIVVAFVAPDTFVSLDSSAPGELGIRWNQVRGQPGPLFYIRDSLTTLLLLYSTVSIVFEMILHCPSRHAAWALAGIVLANASVVFGLCQFHFNSASSKYPPADIMVVAIGSMFFMVGLMIGVIQRYIEQRREVERAYRLNALGLLAGGIAHDFRNVLTGIRGCVDLIKSNPADGERVLKWAGILDIASDRAAEMIEQLALFAREGVPVKSSVPIGEIVRDTVMILSKGLGDRHPDISIVVEIADDVKEVHVNGGQIAQVIQNLILNAIQAMPEGGKVSVLTRNDSARIWSEDPGKREIDFVRITISDEGKGIPKRELRRIFEPYYTTRQEGTGLGLAVTRSFIKGNGGSIFVDSRIGEGTTFDVYLPIGDSPTPSAK